MNASVQARCSACQLPSANTHALPAAEEAQGSAEHEAWALPLWAAVAPPSRHAVTRISRRRSRAAVAPPSRHAVTRISRRRSRAPDLRRRSLPREQGALAGSEQGPTRILNSQGRGPARQVRSGVCLDLREKITSDIVAHYNFVINIILP